MLLLIAVWIFFMRQMQSGSGKAMGFGKSRARLPVEACHPLPALFDAAGLAALPALDCRRADLTQPLCLSSEFAPLNPLKHERFTVAPPERHIIY
ncbi:MAG: hypothetical protein P8X52_10570, partial [Limibacillus sp.]